MFITQDSIVEDAVEVTNDTFIENTAIPATSASLESTSWFNSIIKAVSSYQTPVIVGGAIIAAMLVMAIPAKLMLNKSGKTGGVNVSNYITVNTSSDSSKTVEIEVENPIEPNCPLPPPVVVAPYNLAAIGEVKREEMQKILLKKVHLRTPWERLAVDKWVELYDSN